MRKKMFYLVVLVLTSFSLLHGEERPIPPPPTAEHVAPAPESEPSKHLPQTQENTDAYEHAFIKMLATLVGLLLLVFLTFWALRKLSHGKMGGFGSQKKIKVIEKRPLSPKSILYLVEIDNTQILIAESQLEIRRLAQISPPVDTDT